MSCENNTGGFCNAASYLPQPQFTSYGIYLLKLLGYNHNISNRKHVEWIASLQMPDGGFNIGSRKGSLISHTYYAFRILLQLNYTNSIDKKKFLEFILSCENNTGGFSNYPKRASQLLFTSFALYLLKEVNLPRLKSGEIHLNYKKFATMKC